MKKLFLTVLAAVMCMASGANAVITVNGGNAESYNRQYQTEFKRVCEVCPYADDEMCKNWTPDCDDEDENECTYTSQSACESACGGYQGDTCACFGSGMCWERYINLPKCGTDQYLSEVLCKNKNTGTGSCKQNSTTGCWYFVAGICPYETLAACTSDCSGKCNQTLTGNGCYMCVQSIDGGLTTGGDNSGDDDTTDTTSDTKTISGDCPAGTKKSADGCCCVPN